MNLKKTNNRTNLYKVITHNNGMLIITFTFGLKTTYICYCDSTQKQCHNDCGVTAFCIDYKNCNPQYLHICVALC